MTDLVQLRKVHDKQIIYMAEALTKANKRIEQLERENAELRKDAGRYRWLAAYFVSDDTNHDDTIVAASELGIDHLNAAIDTAMSL